MEYHTFKYPNIELQLANTDEMNKLLESGNPVVKEMFERIAALSTRITFSDDGKLLELDTSIKQSQRGRQGKPFSVEEIKEIQNLYAEGYSRKEIAQKFGVTYAAIYAHT